MTTTQLPDSLIQLLDLVTDPTPKAIDAVYEAVNQLQAIAAVMREDKDCDSAYAYMVTGSAQEIFDALDDLAKLITL